MAHKIKIKGLRVYAHHGVFDFERQNGQDFYIDATVWIDGYKAAVNDDLNATVHYGNLAKAIVDNVKGDPVDLLETPVHLLESAVEPLERGRDRRILLGARQTRDHPLQFQLDDAQGLTQFMRQVHREPRQVAGGQGFVIGLVERLVIGLHDTVHRRFEVFQRFFHLGAIGTTRLLDGFSHQQNGVIAMNHERKRTRSRQLGHRAVVQLLLSRGGRAHHGAHEDRLACEVLAGSIKEGDVLFICSGHGESKKFLEANQISPKTKIIDLSTDFRDESNGFVYGLPEFQKEKIKGATKIANPGCFATSIELAMLPLADKGLINSDIHVSAITGSTGAGQSLSATSHFSWRNNNVSIYKAFTHQHLTEIGMVLGAKNIHFIPYRGNFSRGIMANVYTSFDGTEQEAFELYKNYYKNSPFVFVSDILSIKV